jgi:hypothetical protein
VRAPPGQGADGRAVWPPLAASGRMTEVPHGLGAARTPGQRSSRRYQTA